MPKRGDEVSRIVGQTAAPRCASNSPIDDHDWHLLRDVPHGQSHESGREQANPGGVVGTDDCQVLRRPAAEYSTSEAAHVELLSEQEQARRFTCEPVID